MSHLTLSAINFAWLPILPLAAVAVGAMVIMLIGPGVEDEDSPGLGIIALITLLAALVFAILTLGENSLAFGGSLATDDYAAFYEIMILIATALTVAMSLDYVANEGMAGAEFYALILFAAFGMMLMAAADDLIIVFIGLETMSLAVYALAGFLRRAPRSNEAALKYFILGAFSTGFLLYGIALIYGAVGTISLTPIRAALNERAAENPLLLLGIGMMLIGFGFKVAAVPFHMWTPDAYEGAPTPVTAFMAVGVKVAAFAGFMRVFMANLGPVGAQWTMVLWVIAVLTMTVGNFAALVQQNLKRMLAYSAIAHAGYLLVGMAATPRAMAGGAMLYYLIGYAFTNLGAFAVVIVLERQGAGGATLDDFRGLSRSRPGLALAMTLFMLSLMGVPPLAGFVGKFYIFSAALSAHLVWLVIIAALNSAVSVYYYARVIVVMYAQEEAAAPPPRLAPRPGLVVSVIVAVAGTIIVGLYPQPWLNAANSAYASALGRPQTRIAALR